MALDKFGGLFAASAKSMADSARSIEMFAEILESQVETQNALLTTLVDKIDKIASAKSSGGGGGGGTTVGDPKNLNSLIGGLAADGAKAADGMMKFGEAAPVFRDGLKEISKAMKFWDKIPEESVDRFTQSIDKLAKKFGEMDFKPIAAGGAALMSMSKAIALFGLTLLVASMAYAIIGPLAMITVIPVIAGFSWVFAKIGEASDSIMAGTKTVAWMSLAIIGMGLAMLLTQQLAGGSWGAFIGGALMITAGIALFGIVFHLVGSFENEIEQGAASVFWMGVAIISLAIGLGIWQLFNITFKSILLAAAGVALVGIAFGIIGMFDKYIEAGAAAMLWTGVAIAVLAIGIGAFKLFGINWNDLAITGAAVLGTGLLFAGAGALALFIFLGAVAIMTAGAAMIVLAIGIALLNATYKKAMDGLFAPSDIDGSRSNLEVMIDAIVSAFSINPIDSVFMLVGAAALIVVSIAMILLAAGIWAMEMHVESELWAMSGLTNTDGNPMTNLEHMISSIVYAFSINPIDSIFMLIGAAAMIVVSISMMLLAAGIWALDRHVDSMLWQEATTTPGWSDGGTMTNLQLMIGSIVDAFSINPIKSIFMLIGAAAMIVVSISMMLLAAGMWAIGKHADSELWQESRVSPDWADGTITNFQLIIGSIVDAFYLSPITSVFMMIGSAALIMAGIALMLIAPGISILAKSYSKHPELFETSDHDSDYTNLGMIFNSIVEAMTIGFWDLIDLYAAVPAWLMVGRSLRDIGRGVADFVKIYEAGVDPGDLADAMETILTAVLRAIIDNGPDGDEVDWFSVWISLWTLKDVGKALTGIADGVQKFAELKFPIYNNKGEVVKYLTLNDAVFDKVAINMKLMIGAVADTLTEIGKNQGEVGWFSKSDGEKGADVIKGIGGDLTGIADFVKMAADLRMPKYDENGKLIEGETLEITPDMLGPGGKVSTNIKLMIGALSSALGEIGRSPDNENDWGWFGQSNVDKGKDAVMGVGKDLKDLADVVVAMASIQDMKPIEMKIQQMLLAMPRIIVEVEPQFKKAKSRQKKVIKQLAELNEPLQVILDFMSRAAESKVDQNTGAKLGKSIAKLFDEISKATSKDALQMDKMQPVIDFVSKLSEYQDPISNLADSFEKLADNMDSFVKAYKAMDKKSMDKHKLLIDSLVVFSEVDPRALNAVSDRGKQLLDYINGGGPKEPPTLPEAAPKKQEQSGTKPINTPGGGGPNDKKAQQGKFDTTAIETGLQEINKTLGQIKLVLNGTLTVKEIP